ncbi:hypothetical protein [Lacinutrix algicola]|uniref:hypothetical protein n=1 Tax=Lacinutrix algicola TaxID=342954 RepID=UPI000AC97313
MNLNQVTISSNRTNALVSFYKKLGLKLIVDALPRYARLECPDGEATLSIHFTETISICKKSNFMSECNVEKLSYITITN